MRPESNQLASIMGQNLVTPFFTGHEALIYAMS